MQQRVVTWGQKGTADEGKIIEDKMVEFPEPKERPEDKIEGLETRLKALEDAQ